ncbi:TAXI family TRAP transporter solute-binding subunit [Nitratireductor sp. CAU 1489]|uniref:TAXI family TRAP transporter solute-binding subunit n=1 Tax=Nitratireductor arenosus TaxID=2682096 RepID=A0A844QDL7_9HYPH|nr:TAXI family TRAP transporter solute-binding subunit [Nitratireductor arenosus]MVA96198.1 TAXI family TRAP transporter solute-binding subunit [Nitratireductor arenosus]
MTSFRMVAFGLVATTQAFMFGGQAAAQSLPPRVVVGAQQVGTLQHTVASALAKVATDAIDTTLVVQPYAGATALLPVLDGGELDFGVSPSVDYALSYRGADKLKIDGRNPYPHGPKLRLVMGGSPLIASLIVRDDSEIRSANDLAGRKVAGDFPAQLGAYVNMFAQLRSADLSWDDVTVVPFSAINDSLDAVMQGTIDATVFGVGAPKVREADASVGVRFISSDCSDEGKQRIVDTVPGYYTIDIKGGKQAAIDEDICTTAYQLYLVTHEAADPAMVRAVLKAIWDNVDQLPQYHPSLRNWNQASAVPTEPTLPFHPAAIEFYREVGAWSEAMDAQQEALLKLGQ